MSSSTKHNKTKRIKFGLFKTEKDAEAENERRQRNMPKKVDANFGVVRIKRSKEGKRSWLAYALVKKKGK